MAAITHQYICGDTLTGKSTVAKRQAAAVVRSGRGVIVHDPTAPVEGWGGGGWPKGAWVCQGFESFNRVFWRSRACLAIIDEAGEVFGEKHKFDGRLWLTRGRHHNPLTGGGLHTCLLITQRHVMVDKTARLQCSVLYAFASGVDDAEHLASDWRCPALADARSPFYLAALKPLHYVYLRRHGSPMLGRISF